MVSTYFDINLLDCLLCQVIAYHVQKDVRNARLCLEKAHEYAKLEKGKKLSNFWTQIENN